VGRRVSPYAMASVRAKIAYVLLVIFGATVAGSFLALGADWATAGAIKDFVEPVLTAEVGLLGAVMGFYFATHEHETHHPGVRSSESEPPGDA
jgi:uncharacterized membrane protein YGL010W